VILLLDDAHAFKPAALEEIERLLAFKVDKRVAFDLLAVGPVSIARQWQRSQAQVAPADVVVCALSLASLENLVGYLEWRLDRFEMRDLMSPVAAQMIARLSGGRYAAADVLCQMSLLLLRQLSLERVDARVVRQAVATLAARQSAKLETNRPDDNDQRVDVPPQGYLVISKGGKVLTRATLGQRTLVGRSEHNDICLPSPYLSRHHAVVVGTPEGYYLVDLNSVNGVVLNGRRVERAALCDQDVLTIGPFRLKVQIPEGLAQGSPFPEAESLADTAVMPPHAQDNSAVWRVK